MLAVEQGFRLRVPATYLWFNVEETDWARIRAALMGMGAEGAQGGLDGEELCALAGLTVSYRGQEQRMQAEVGPEGGAAAAAGLSGLRQAAPRPAAEASPIWLWSPERFEIGGQLAEPAERLVRGGRWRLPRDRNRDVLDALAEALGTFDGRATVQLEVHSDCTLSVTTPLNVTDGTDRERRAKGFGGLLARLGEPLQADHVTWA